VKAQPQPQQYASSSRWRVRVWFGDHPIADYTAEQELAARYAAAMKSRFGDLPITTEPVLANPQGATAIHT
jgi:hypothetical protein